MVETLGIMIDRSSKGRPCKMGSLSIKKWDVSLLKLIPSNKREKTQREILKDFDIDIEDFMKGNPILIRDRQRGI